MVTVSRRQPIYGVSELLQHDRFDHCVRTVGGGLLGTHRQYPREVRYMADIQRWLMTNGVFWLHFGRQGDAAAPSLTPANMQRLICARRIAGRNTVTAFVKEMEQYKLLVPARRREGRSRALKCSEHAEQLMLLYFLVTLAALDVLDEGGRSETLAAHPQLLSRLQPGVARRLLASDAWCFPPRPVELFTRVDSGSNILHELMGRVPSGSEGQERIVIGPMTSTHVAARYLISLSHVTRVFARARDLGLMGWSRPNHRGECWVAAQLVQDYRHWQAVKFSAVAEAFAEAVEVVEERAAA